MDLLEYLRIIRKRKALIVITALVGAALFFISTFVMQDVYRATAIITPVSNKDGAQGSLGLLAQQFGGLASFGLPGSTSDAELINLLKSNVLREKVVERHDLLPVLFHERWDPEKKAWKAGSWPFGAKEPPKTWDALRRLDKIVKVNKNSKENMINITVEFDDPEAASKIAGLFLQALNEHMSSEAKRVASTNRRYLEGQLDSTQDPLIRQKIYTLIAQQIETGMMAEVKENFAFKVIDPPRTPDRKIRPRRLSYTALGFVGSLFAGLLFAFIVEYAQRAKVTGREEGRTNA